MYNFAKIFKKIIKNSNSTIRVQSSARPSFTVLGIETSCDDTGIGIVNSRDGILSESLCSQQNVHLKYGGIIPPRAQELHRNNIEKTVANCFEKSSLNWEKIDAIAVTNRPGLPLSLIVGVRYAKHLARKYSLPIIPIHHMEAHALAVRLEESSIQFPYLCLLISGGHSQLVFVKNSSIFFLLGETLDDAPGEAFDKISRRLKLRNLPQFEWLNGGLVIETAARDAKNPNRFEFPLPLARQRDCQFSFAGLKNSAIRHIKQTELKYKVRPDEIIPYYTDFCGGFLNAIARHISNRTQRAIEYCNRKKLFRNEEDNDDLPKFLVISGGVACNDLIFEKLSKMAETYGFKTYRPSKALCRDNGVMIAWNGIEKVNENRNCLIHENNFDNIDIYGKCSLGENIIKNVVMENIKCKWVKVVK